MGTRASSTATRHTTRGHDGLTAPRMAATARPSLQRRRLTMTVTQAWILVVEVGIVALAALIGLLRR